MSVIHRAQNVGHLLDTMYGVRGPCTVLMDAVRYQGRMSEVGRSCYRLESRECSVLIICERISALTWDLLRSVLGF